MGSRGVPGSSPCALRGTSSLALSAAASAVRPAARPACSFRHWLLSPPPPAPAAGVWLFPFNIHLEMPN